MLETDHTARTLGDRLICFSDALNLIGVSRSTAYRMLQQGALPRTAKIGARTFFSECELQDWIAEKLAQRGDDPRNGS